MFALMSAGAVLQLALPAQAARPVMAALCSGGAPIPLPMKHRDSEACCKVCHSARRARAGGDTCCATDGEKDEE